VADEVEEWEVAGRETSKTGDASFGCEGAKEVGGGEGSTMTEV